MFTIVIRTSIRSRGSRAKTDANRPRETGRRRRAHRDRARSEAALGLSRALDRSLARHPDHASRNSSPRTSRTGAIEDDRVGRVLRSDHGTATVLHLDHLWIVPVADGPWQWPSVVRTRGRLKQEPGDSDSIKIEADPNAEAFYQRMGAKRVTDQLSARSRAKPRELPLMEYRWSQLGTGRTKRFAVAHSILIRHL